jgi:vacuolar-type H+-ATPase subunit F/Vma7
MKTKDYRIAAVGSDLLTLGMKLAGISESYPAHEGEEAEARMHELLGRDDIGIIIVTSGLVKKMRDRKILNAVNNSVTPLVVQIPDYSEAGEEEADVLNKLILRAIGIDLSAKKKSGG